MKGMNKRGFALLVPLVIILIISVGIAGIISNERLTGHATYGIMEGDGTSGDPFVIQYIEDLYYVRDNLTAYYILNRSLDFNDDDSYFDIGNKTQFITGNGWLPIGNATSPFSGNFNGQNYNFSNLFINRSAENYIGLFGYINSGEISNLNLLNISVIGGSQSIGGLVGYNNLGEIFNSSSIGNVTGSEAQQIGGLIGWSNGVVNNSYSKGSVNGTNTIGGLIGYIGSSGGVYNSYSRSSVNGTNGIGGLVGINVGGIFNSYSTGSVTGTSDKGGLIGQNTGSVSNSFYDSDTSGQYDDAGKGTPKTTLEMKSISTFSDWDISDSILNENDGYPFLSWQVSGDNPIWYIYNPCTNIYDSGDGSSGNPYVIDNLEGIYCMRENLTAYYVLNRSLDFNNEDHYIESSNKNLYTTGLGWEPIGTDPSPFSGNFNGQNYNISNLFINRSSSYYIGLFGKTSTISNISNFGLININILGYSFVGGLIGYNYNGLVSNCYSVGSVKGVDDYLGGLIGAVSNGNISNSYSIGDVNGTGYYIGGLIGSNQNGNIYNSYTTGTVIGNSQYLGGLIGSSRGSVSNSYSTADVTGPYSEGFHYYTGGLIGSITSGGSVYNSYATGNVTGESIVGGLVGQNLGGNLSNSYATGNVNGSSFSIGGLVGRIEDSGNVSNSYATGNVTGTINIGGLVGNIISGNVFNSYAVGNVNKSGASVGGLIGSITSGSVSNSFYDINTSGQDDTGKGTPKTTLEMKKISTFTVWDILRYSISDENNGYPFLSWQVSGNSPIWYIPDVCGGIYSSGDGSSENPYIIDNLEGVYCMNENLTAYYVLNKSLDFNDDDSYDQTDVGWATKKISWITSNGWEPIGNLSSPFSGNFNGQGYNISNLFINRSSEDYGGLFGRTNNSYISNTGLIDINVFGGYFAGGLIGYNDNGSIFNSYSTGNVTGIHESIGGLIGHTEHGNISGSYSTANLNGTNFIGGLIGSAAASIYDSYSTGNVNGAEYIGGLVGQFSGNLFNSYSTGDVNGTTSRVGGLIGLFGGNISNSYSTGNVNGPEYIGGLIGISSGNVSNSYSTGNVTGTSSTGGLVGSKTAGEIFNSFYDTNTSGQSDTGKGEPKTTLEMKNISTFSDWDISGYSISDENNGYPFLSWQVPGNSPAWYIYDVCGNNLIGVGEVCDGTNLSGQTCVTKGYSSGTLACAGNCLSFDTSGCSSGGGSSGGGGGGTCTDSWNCTSWSPCSSAGIQTRTCTYTGTCSTLTRSAKPSEQQTCQSNYTEGEQATPTESNDLGDVNEVKQTSLKQGSVNYFSVNNNQHSIEIKEITENKVIVIIQSEPVEVELEIGETKIVELNGDKIQITLEDIVDGEAIIDISEFTGGIPLGEYSLPLWVLIVIIFVIIVFIFIMVLLIIHFNKEETEQEIKEEKKSEISEGKDKEEGKQKINPQVEDIPTLPPQPDMQ